MRVEIGAGGRREGPVYVLNWYFSAENVIHVYVSGIGLGQHVLIDQILDLLCVTLVVTVP